jgi:hypothetical protein
MKKSTILRAGGFIGSAGLTVALVGAGAAGTGAYFSDTEVGSVSGTYGSIEIDATDTTIAFENMLPGEAQKKLVTFKNSGKNTQDVWIVFDATALGDGTKTTDHGKINDLGKYGEVHIKSSGTAVFDSANLNDDATSCPVGAGPEPVCAPLPRAVKLRSNLVPGASGNFEFSYTVAAMTKARAEGANTFVPLPYKIVATQTGIDPLNTMNSEQP